MIHTYFLGANTPEGFHSEYRTLQTDPRIRQLRIIKGGSGCGKSTLMKTVGEAADQVGLATERIPCSSDPDSLDGLVIPEIGFALVDGTAPHVIEPELCGCGANYLDLGKYYRDSQGLALRPALAAEKAANQSCYGPAYGCLAAAAAAEQVVRSLAGRVAGEKLLQNALRQLSPEGLRTEERCGSVRRCFLSALTPAGLRSLDPDCRTLWAIEDSFRIGSGLLSRLETTYRKGGFDVVRVLDPMAPSEAAGLVIPELETGYLRLDPLFSLGGTALLRLSLDASVEAGMEKADRICAERMLDQRKRFVEEALSWLSRAKACHDRLEALCRPLVDFDGVSRETEQLIRNLLTEA